MPGYKPVFLKISTKSLVAATNWMTVSEEKEMH